MRGILGSVRSRPGGRLACGPRVIGALMAGVVLAAAVPGAAGSAAAPRSAAALPAAAAPWSTPALRRAAVLPAVAAIRQVVATPTSAPAAPAPGPVANPAAPAPSGPVDTLAADLAALVAASAGTAPPPTASDGDGEGDEVPGLGVPPELVTVAVSSRMVSEAERSVRATRADIDAALADEAAAAADGERLQRDVGTLDVGRTGLEAELAGQRQREQAARARAAEQANRAAGAKDLLQELATAAYVGVGADPPELESPKVTDGTRRTTYRRNLFELKRSEWLAYLAQEVAAAAEADGAAADAAGVVGNVAGVDAARAGNRAAAQQAEGRRLEAVTREATLRVRLGQAEAVLVEVRRTATVVGLDLPLVVLDALWSASAAMAAERPTCHLRWNLLAGISRVESAHGRFGTSSVDRNGDVQPRIVGRALDGQGVALIPDSDAGRLDGDTTFDRAVGPMQFIPTSWALFARDGNGDGRGDPNNYYDAALGAAEHLCRAGADTATEAGLRAAVLSYNPSEDYLRVVVGAALAYARFTPPG